MESNLKPEVSDDEMERVAFAIADAIYSNDILARGGYKRNEWLKKYGDKYSPMAKAAIAAMRDTKPVSNEEMVPKYALDSQIAICNELRARCELLEGKPIVERSRPVPADAFDAFTKEMEETVIPEVLEIMRKRAKAAIASRGRLLKQEP